jgi:hypothetical protein
VNALSTIERAVKSEHDAPIVPSQLLGASAMHLAR